MKKIIRVFPTKTKATPDDKYAYYGDPDLLVPECDEIHISVTFTWDIEKAHKLAEQWEHIAPVKIGGVAMGDRGGEFEPGLYLKNGYTITSRGCKNKCWFCDVWKREGNIREIGIKDGWNILDSNLLACSDNHIIQVFKMLELAKKKWHKIEFTGGLEAKRLQDRYVNYLSMLKPKQIFFAYDTPDDYEPLVIAGKMLTKAVRNKATLRCYCLIGYPKDTFELAEKRLHDIIKAGFMPMAMLYRDKTGKTNDDWRKFQRIWARPAIMRHLMKAKG
jgi:hypothetical protein